MEHHSNRTSPILTDTANTRIGIHSAMLPYPHNNSSFPSNKLITVPWRMSGILDDVGSSLFDAMILSSPTHDKCSCKSSTETPITDADLACYNWLLKYPSALNSFEQIANSTKGKQIVLFLDYDGTLSPIVDNPDHAFMSCSMRAAVGNVAKYFPTAIITGRSRDKVNEFVGLTELYYAGSHGMDIMGPAQPLSSNYRNCMKSTDKQGKDVNLFQPALEFLPMINEVYRSLIEITKDIAGAKVENNKFCVSVHYRNVDEKSWAAVGQCVLEILKEFPRLCVTHGRKVLEVRPVLNRDKGKAVEFLLESLGLTNWDDVLPIYVGDDRTDEDAFKVLREGNRGYGIIVSSVPKESNAFYSLRDPSEVMEFLKALAKLKKKSAL